MREEGKENKKEIDENRIHANYVTSRRRRTRGGFFIYFFLKKENQTQTYRVKIFQTLIKNHQKKIQIIILL